MDRGRVIAFGAAGLVGPALADVRRAGKAAMEVDPGLDAVPFVLLHFYYVAGGEVGSLSLPVP